MQALKLTLIAAAASFLVLEAVPLFAQSNQAGGRGAGGQVNVFGLGGSSIGASIRDLESSDTAKSGVVVEDVQAGSPAEKAGLRKADIVTRFDGESVRSARQLSRLVQETPAGRTIPATVLRDGKSVELSLTPQAGASFSAFNERNYLAQFKRLDDQITKATELALRSAPKMAFAFGGGPARLGVAVQPLTPQLATYFGAKDGALVTTVTDGSPASRAGLRAGDVIVSVNKQPVSSPADLSRVIGSVTSAAEVTIAIVRDKKETTVTAKLEEMPGKKPALRRIIASGGNTAII